MGNSTRTKKPRSGHNSGKKKRVGKGNHTNRPSAPTAAATNLERVRKRGKKKMSLADYTSRLTGSSFRMLNERLYCDSPDASFSFFHENPASFRLYHEGFREQVASWPLNPVDACIQDILANHRADEVVIDVGCGEGQLALSVPNPTRSFDLVALKPHVEVANMTALPVPDGFADVAVFSLSLMSPQLSAILLEANRALKPDGLLKIAEVRSRIEDEDDKRTPEEQLEVKEGEGRRKREGGLEGGNKKKKKRRNKKKRDKGGGEEEQKEDQKEEGIGYRTWDRKLEQLGFELVERRMLSPMFVWMAYRKKREGTQTETPTDLGLQPCIYKRR